MALSARRQCAPARRLAVRHRRVHLPESGVVSLAGDIGSHMAPSTFETAEVAGIDGRLHVVGLIG